MNTQDTHLVLDDDKIEQLTSEDKSAIIGEYCDLNWIELERKLGKVGLERFSHHFIQSRIDYYTQDQKQAIESILGDDTTSLTVMKQAKVDKFDKVLEERFHIPLDAIQKLSYVDKKIIRGWTCFDYLYKNLDDLGEEFIKPFVQAVMVCASMAKENANLTMDDRKKYFENSIQMFSEEVQKEYSTNHKGDLTLGARFLRRFNKITDKLLDIFPSSERQLQEQV